MLSALKYKRGDHYFRVENLQVVANIASFDIDAAGTVTLTGTTASISLERGRIYEINKVKVIPLYFDQSNLSTLSRYRYLNNEQFAYGGTMNANINGITQLFLEQYIGFSNTSIDNIQLFTDFVFKTDASNDSNLNFAFNSTGTIYSRFENLSYGNTGGALVAFYALICFEGYSCDLTSEDLV